MRCPHPLATLTLSLLTLLASAFEPSGADLAAPLNKPALKPPGGLPELLMAHFPSTPATYTKRAANEVPRDCIGIAIGPSVQKEPKDFEVYNVKYEDCRTEWIFCRHKSSEMSISEAVSLFGRIPVGARQFVRHFLVFPRAEPNPSAYSTGNSIFIFGDISLASIFHEVGHILDGGKVFMDGQLAASKEWKTAVDRDGHVSDPFAARNLVETVAQITVVVFLDLTLRPGYSLIQPEWQKLRNQASLVRDLQAKAGNLLVPGQGSCDGRKVPDSEIVNVNPSTGEVTKLNKAGPKLRRGVRARAEKPDISLGEGLKVFPSMESETEMFGPGHKQ